MPISVKKNVAILVTVYNGELYLESTLRSLVAQDYECVSIVIVDDCSGDRSPEIIDVYLEKYGNLKLLKSSNPKSFAVPNAMSEYPLKSQ